MERGRGGGTGRGEAQSLSLCLICIKFLLSTEEKEEGRKDIREFSATLVKAKTRKSGTGVSKETVQALL